MEQSKPSDNKFYIAIIIAVLALIVGAIGLTISLTRSKEPTALPANSMLSSPPTGGSPPQHIQFDPQKNGSSSGGTVESPKTN